MLKPILAASALTLLLTLTGCGDPTAPITLAPTPSATPLFASDEEALAAAEAAYAKYSAVADQIFAEGGANPQRLATVATGDFLDASIEGFERAQREGIRSTGRSVFRSVTLQSYQPNSREATVSVYLCDDISEVDVLDATGKSVVSPDRPNTTTFQVTFDLSATDALLVSSREAWSNESC